MGHAGSLASYLPACGSEISRSFGLDLCVRLHQADYDFVAISIKLLIDQALEARRLELALVLDSFFWRL